MSRVVNLLLIAIGGLCFGVASAAGVLVLSFDRTWVQFGPWRTNSAIGRPQADMYTRAQVAVGGVLALPTSEVVYLISERDDQGRRLRSTCRYRVLGGALPARWWSLTVYGSDRFLIPNAGGRYSYTSSELGAGDKWTVTLSRDHAAEPWLPLGAREETVILVLRLYHADVDWADALNADEVPQIVSERCA